MDRVYMNRRDGERRIHIEIDEGEINGLLSEAGYPGATTARLLEILRSAQQRFAGQPQVSQ